MGMSKAELRRLARKQQAEVRREDEAKERAAREAKERQKRAREIANENDVVEFLQASATIAAAQERLDAVLTKQKLVMGAVVGRIAGREGSVGRAAKLLDISPHQASGLQRFVSEAAAQPHAADDKHPTTGGEMDTASDAAESAIGVPDAGLAVRSDADDHLDDASADVAFEQSA